MKPILLTGFFIIFAVSITLVTPILSSLAKDTLTSLQVPQNTPQVAGIQKINIPPVSQDIAPPTLSAKAVLVKDLATDTILYQNQVNIPVPIASTTKIMTALVGSEYFKPNSVLTVNKADAVSGSKIGLHPGESLSFRSLLYGMLLNSGNDCAYTIAENYPGGVLGFVSAMNKKAIDLNLRNTHFENPAGFDNPNHFASAADLAKITQEALKDSQLSRIFATKDTEISSLDKKYTHPLHNLNQLLSTVKGVMGVKTGFTQEAKENLVILVEREGHKILTIVLGSDDRFGDSTKLIEWVYNNYLWQ